jgi:AcrR family transcriptional regulator
MTAQKPAPISRRERPAKPALTREGIVATALEVMRAEGLDRVTMRRLATELDTGAASLYVCSRVWI